MACLNRRCKNFHMAEVLADKAYSSREMLGFIEGLGAAPFIPFRNNAKSAEHGSACEGRPVPALQL